MIMDKITIDEDYMRQVLGEHSFSRLIMCANCSAGWDDGNGRPISNSSAMLMQAYFKQHYPRDFTPPVYETKIHSEANKAMSLFMTSEGNLVLNWMDYQLNNFVELTFCDDGKSIEYHYGLFDNTTVFNIGDKDIPIYKPKQPQHVIRFTDKPLESSYNNWINYWNKLSSG